MHLFLEFEGYTIYGCFIILSERILSLQGRLALPHQSQALISSEACNPLENLELLLVSCPLNLRRGGKSCNPFSWSVGGNSGSLWRSDLVLSGRPMVLWGRADPTQWPEIASSVHFTLKWELIHVSSNVVPLLWSWEAGVSRQLWCQCEEVNH